MRSLLTFLAATLGWGLLAADYERLDVFPSEINLASSRSQAQLIVTGRMPSGEARDLTHVAEIFTGNPQVARVNHAIVSPVGDGKTLITVRAGSALVKVPVQVHHQAEADPIRFSTETLAALTKQGCNAGSCHGSPQGKAGFSLSLFGFDPVHDELALVRGGLNRRLNVLDPDESLMLKKPLLRLPHVGGKRLRPADPAYQVLRQWIFEGARGDPEDAPKCVRIKVYPGQERVLRVPHLNQQLSVQAYFSDGKVRDVTDLAAYKTSNRLVATVDANGLVTGSERGLAAITVRYLEHLESIYFTVVRDLDGFVWKPPSEHNYVDRLVNAQLQLLQIEPARTCSDGVFLRRVYLDLTGLLPPPNKARAFLADQTPNKRAQLIDELLDTREFSRFQALQLADLLRVNPETLTEGRASLFAQWITDSVSRNRPFDEMTRDLLTASGDSRSVAPANYFAAIPGTENTIETTTQVFMGSRIQCAKCHNHPFENWTQTDYYRIGAVFNRLQRDKGLIRMADSGEMTHPRTGRVMLPWGDGGDDKDRRVKFAEWLTATDNPWFARTAVNRIWAHLLGRGIVEPIDDFRSSNPPSNVELLDTLAADLTKNGFDRRHIFRVICNSQVYQRATQTTKFNALDEENFSHARVRLLSAEQLNDAIAYFSGALASPDQIDKMTNNLRSEEQALVAGLDARQPQWEEEQARSLSKSDLWQGAQWSLGFFAAKDQKEAHEKVFIPETDNPVDLVKHPWQLQVDWPAGKTVTFPEKEIGARYIYHTIWTRKPARVKLYFVADDGVRAWHNGKLFYDQIQIMNEPKTQYGVTELAGGLNHFLFKVNNRGGDFHFTLKLTEFDGQPVEKALRSKLPGYVPGILHKAASSRSAGEKKHLRDYHHSLDSTLTDLRQRLGKDNRLLYATQRPWPEQTVFLKAFGQPERKSPCACERSNAPTLEQALQLLNGSQVYDHVKGSHKRYVALKDDRLVEEIYLAAFSRGPTPKERDIALLHLKGKSGREEAIHDLVWALINTQEFMFQH